jgi:hypothetical protein
MEKQSKSNQFIRASDRIDMKSFERESNRLFLLGLAIGMVFLSIVVSFVTFEKVRIIRARQIPIKLIIRPQRPTELYRISREDVIKSIRRRAAVMRKPSTGTETKTLPVSDYGEFEITIDYDPDTISSSDMLPDSLLIEEYASRRMKETIPLKNQVLFDTGTYKSEIIISPHNKKAIQGYTHIALGWGENLTPPDTLRRAVQNLIKVLTAYTNITASRDRRVDLGSPELFTYPFIYITTDKSFTLNDNELRNLKRYLLSGGFVILDNGVPEYDTGHIGKALKKMVLDALNPPDLTDPKRGGIRPIPKRHPIYHCFFDFDDGPPQGYGSSGKSAGSIYGIYWDRNLVGVYCPQGYGRMWHNPANEEQLKMGVNLVVNALAPGKWYNNDNRLAFSDKKTRTYTEWYENGNVRFKASEWLGKSRLSWIPSQRKVQRIVKSKIAGKTLYDFIYREEVRDLIKKRKWYAPIGSLKLFYWGDYNIYEGWYGNGQKMYYYNYNDSTFAEWDGEGIIIASEGGFSEMNNENRENLANHKH